MLPALTLGHVALGLVTVIYGVLIPRGRAAVARVAAVGGIACSATMFALRSEGLQWRSLELEPTSAAIVAVATGCAWLLVATLALDRDRAITAALVGAASSSMILFGINRWVVPALLFGLCAVGALMALIAGTERTWPPSVALLGFAALLAGSLGGHVAESGSWELPFAAGGLAGWPAIAAALLGSGALGVVGPWTLAGSSAAPAMPLIAGMALTTAAFGHNAAPWAAAVLLTACAAASFHALTAHRVRLRIVGAASMLAALAVMLAAPPAAAIPAVAGILGVTALALPPPDRWGSAAARVSLVVPVPATIAFAALISGAANSVERAIATDGVFASASWAAVAVLIPVVLATGLMFGVRALRAGTVTAEAPPPGPERDDSGPALAVAGTTSPGGIRPRLRDGPAVAAGALLTLSVGLAATTGPGPDLGTNLDGGTTVYATGMVLAAAAAIASRRRGIRKAHTDRAPAAIVVACAGWAPSPRLHRPAAIAAAATTGALVAGTMWLTWEGLRAGFL